MCLHFGQQLFEGAKGLVYLEESMMHAFNFSFYRQKVARLAFPAVSATTSTAGRTEFGSRVSAKSTSMSKSMTLGTTFTGSRMERCTSGMVTKKLRDQINGTHDLNRGIFSVALQIHTSFSNPGRRRGCWNRCDSRRRRLQW